jgi:hypothetical protein
MGLQGGFGGLHGSYICVCPGRWRPPLCSLPDLSHTHTCQLGKTPWAVTAPAEGPARDGRSYKFMPPGQVAWPDPAVQTSDGVRCHSAFKCGCCDDYLSCPTPVEVSYRSIHVQESPSEAGVPD